MDKKLVKQIIERADNLCEICRSPWWLEIHHKAFRSHGGKDTLDNCTLLCKKCHGKAHGLRIVSDNLEVK